LAKPNYSFEKRQRELAKKKKQEEKEARKREARGAAAAPTPEPDAPIESEGPATPAVAGPRVHLRKTPSSRRLRQKRAQPAASRK
jgi:hypothetical protein